MEVSDELPHPPSAQGAPARTAPKLRPWLLCRSRRARRRRRTRAAEPPVIDDARGHDQRHAHRAQRARRAGQRHEDHREQIERSGARNVPDLLRREAGHLRHEHDDEPEGYTVEARGFNNGGGNGCLDARAGRRAAHQRARRRACPDWRFVPLDNVERSRSSAARRARSTATTRVGRRDPHPHAAGRARTRMRILHAPDRQLRHGRRQPVARGGAGPATASAYFGGTRPTATATTVATSTARAAR